MSPNCDPIWQAARSDIMSESPVLNLAGFPTWPGLRSTCHDQWPNRLASLTDGHDRGDGPFHALQPHRHCLRSPRRDHDLGISAGRCILAAADQSGRARAGELHAQRLGRDDGGPVRRATAPGSAAAGTSCQSEVYDTAYVNGDVVVVGAFTQACQPGTLAQGLCKPGTQVTRDDIFAYQAGTGLIDPNFAPQLDKGPAWTVIAGPAGSNTVYVGGSFTIRQRDHQEGHRAAARQPRRHHRRQTPTARS